MWDDGVAAGHVRVSARAAVWGDYQVGGSKRIEAVVCQSLSWPSAQAGMLY